MLPSLRRTALNLGSLWSNKVLSMLFGFLVTGISTRAYGLEAMGLWLMAVNAASYISLFDFGAASALPRVMPALRVQGKQAQSDGLVRTTYLSSWAVAAVGLVLTGLAFWLGHYCALPLGDGSAQGLSIYAIAFAFAFVGLPYRAGFGLLASVHRFDLFAWMELAGVALKLLFIVGTVYFLGGGLIFYAVGALFFPFLANVVQYRTGIRLTGAAYRTGAFSRSSFKLLLSHCGPSLMLSSATMILIQGSTLIAGGSGTALAAIYGYPLQLVVSVKAITASVGVLLSPVASTLHGERDEGRVVAIAAQSIRLSSAFSIVLALLLLSAGPWLMTVWLGGPKVSAESLSQMIRILELLAIGNVFLSPANVLCGLFLGIGRQWEGGSAELCGALFGVVLGWVLMTKTSMGLMGLVLGVNLSYALRGMVLFPALAARLMGLSLWKSLGEGFALPVAVGLAAWGALFAFQSYTGGSHTFWPAVFGSAIVAAVWGAGTWLFVFDAALRARLLAPVKRWVGSVA